MQKEDTINANFSKIIDWYRQRILTTLHKSRKKPHLKNVVAILEKDMISTLSSEVIIIIKEILGEQGKKNIKFVKKIADTIIKKVSKDITNVILEASPHTKNEAEPRFNRIYFWIKSLVYSELNLSFSLSSTKN